MDKFLLFIALLDIFSDVCCNKCHDQKNSQTIISKSQQQQILYKVAEQCFTPTIDLKDTYCEQVFDGLMCWAAAKPGTVSYQKCPSYVHKFNPEGYATKTCLENGEWFFNPAFNKTWTNFTGCLSDGSVSTIPDIVKTHLPHIQILYNIGYGVSLVSLLIAVILMLYFRKLHCQRNTVHVNMFISFILRSIICFIKDIDITPEVYSSYGLDENTTFSEAWICKMVSTLFYYILTANFMWIFVEGLFLHTFVLSTKYNVSKILYRTFLVLGWCVPFMTVIPWVIVRVTFDNTLCWNIIDDYFWIIKGPIMVTNVINLIFFINIIRVLYTKLNASNTRDPKKYRKLARSTLVLIPLFGVYYVVFIAVPMCLEPEMEVIRMYTEMFFNSFQGFAVALLFCFLNGEVKREIRKHWRRRMLRRPSNMSARSKTFTTVAGDHEMHHSSLPNSWDSNGNMELKEVTIPVCNVDVDLIINQSQENEELSPILNH